MIRDVLAERLARPAGSGTRPDYQRIAHEVLGIRGASADLARRLVEQALVLEDRRDHWRQVGERVCVDAPRTPGIYVFRDAEGRALYVGKAMDLRRRLRAHFADRRWQALAPAVARVEHVEWQTTGSELEAILREAWLIDELRPMGNIQLGEPVLRTRAVPGTLVRDVAVLLPSVDPQSVEIVAARVNGDVMLERADRAGGSLAETSDRLWAFFNQAPDTARDGSDLALAPLVFSWLAGRGRTATRVDPHDLSAAGDLAARLHSLFSDTSLFVERLVAIR